MFEYMYVYFVGRSPRRFVRRRFGSLGAGVVDVSQHEDAGNWTQLH